MSHEFSFKKEESELYVFPALHTIKLLIEGKVSVRMRVIRFTYHNTEVDLSVYLLLFLRSAGIYAYERFYEQREIRNGIRFPDGSIDNIEPFEKYDADIYIGSGMDGSLTEMEGRIPICYISCENKTNSTVAKELLDTLLEKHIIEPGEWKDLKGFLAIYDQYRMWKWLLKARYFFPFKDRRQTEKLVNQYSDCVMTLLGALQNKQIEWGNQRNEHLQYAAMNAVYELNWFCDRNDMPLVCLPETVIEHCESMQLGFSDYLGDSVRMLEAMVYNDLLDNSNKAYEFYVSSCRSDTTYNAYVFLRKGLYWQNFTKQYDQAIKYYLKSVKIFPEYYRAWFKLGLCYQKMKQYKEALYAYGNVKQILLRRLNEKQIRPLEIEHLLRSQMYTLAIWQEFYHNNINALEAGRMAERAAEAIDNSEFWSYMCDNEEDIIMCKEYVKRCLPIQSVYMKLRNLYQTMGDTEKEREYDRKLAIYEVEYSE